MTADIKKELADEAVRIVTGARRSAYGKPEQNFERIARLWNAHLVNVGILRNGAGGLQTGDVAAFMRLMKEARLAETPDHRDSFVDLVGYALCGAEVAGVSTEYGKAFDEIMTDIAAAEPTPDADGWIAWEGGKMPVPGDTLVEYRMADSLEGDGRAQSLRWAHYDWPGDIVAYRVVKS